MTATPSRDYARLADIVHKRRLELGMPIAAIAEKAGVSKDTYRKIEEGGSVRDVTYAKIEPALRWAAGSCWEILAGATAPIAVARPEHDDTVEYRPPGASEEDVLHAVTAAAIAVADNLTAKQINDLSRHVLKELQRRGVL